MPYPVYIPSISQLHIYLHSNLLHFNTESGRSGRGDRWTYRNHRTLIRRLFLNYVQVFYSTCRPVDFVRLVSQLRGYLDIVSSAP